MRAKKSRALRRRRSAEPSLIRRHAGTLVSTGAVVALIGLMWMAGAERPAPGQRVSEVAPRFALPATDGTVKSLEGYRGRNVLLYFNEGVGCDSCFTQMVQLEAHDDHLERVGVTVLPVVTNPPEMVASEAARFGIRTPFLSDATKRTSAAYGVLGTGHHADLPGHSFILVDGEGIIRWRGDYPSMFVSPDGLLSEVRRALP